MIMLVLIASTLLLSACSDSEAEYAECCKRDREIVENNLQTRIDTWSIGHWKTILALAHNPKSEGGPGDIFVPLHPVSIPHPSGNPTMIIFGQMVALECPEICKTYPNAVLKEAAHGH